MRSGWLGCRLESGRPVRGCRFESCLIRFLQCSIDETGYEAILGA